MASTSIQYIDAKNRVVRAINRVTTFVKASVDFNNDRTNLGKRAKIGKMLSELNDLRQNIERDIEVMETNVAQKLAPEDVVDNQCSASLIDSFDSMYYELAAFSDVHNFSMSSRTDVSLSQPTMVNQTISPNNHSMFQLPKRKFPIFSGKVTEWQGFEDLFKSILSHAPHLPDVERFEYLKTSLQGEALSLISHLALTAANYGSAWEILRARYGNKRDLARIHFEALLTPCVVNFNNANSIKILINTILEHTAALDNLEFTTRQWSPLLVYIFENYLDYELRSRWELCIGDKYRPQMTEFVDFLRSHIRSAEIHSTNPAMSSHLNKSSKTHQTNISKFRSTSSPKVLTTNASQSSGMNCLLCKKAHPIRKCPVFIEKSPTERFQTAKSYHLCINCLGTGHSVGVCKSTHKCQTCSRSHHTMLHFDPISSASQTPITEPVSTVDLSSSTAALIVKGQPQKIVLLSTVLLNVCAADGRRHSLRALLDSGSQASFITDKSAHVLMLPRRHSPINITTFANTSSRVVRGKVTITITPCGKDTPVFYLDTLIVPQITGLTPQISMEPGKWDHITNLLLADPSYNISGPIDLLLGADILPSLLLNNQRSGQSGEPIALETVFGWVLMGPTKSHTKSSINSLCVSVYDSLDTTLKGFWELEELPVVHHFSPEDTIAENFYKSTTTRLASGRFMVAIPFKKPYPVLGDSKGVALQRFKALEFRLNRNNDLRQQYSEFMRDYLNAGHMELIPAIERNCPLSYYIPHHCVMRPDSSTTKLRVVFNASSKTTIGISLNESMYTGPKLQPDIQIILLRARLWKYVFMTDIKQMYRQILVRAPDRDYLRIFWRFSIDSPIDEYRLCTVTYGTSAAPFQAIRTLQELANTDGASYPLAASILLNDTFVDDIFTGADSEEDAIKCQTELIKLCSNGHFELRKWASNNRTILQNVPEEFRAVSSSFLFDNSEQSELKVLGLKWDLTNDSFSFKAHSSSEDLTKRSVLSDIARIFDPLGLLCPVTFWAKHFMQLLWTTGVDWDTPIPSNLASLWKRFQSELHSIETLSIPRRLTHDQATSIQLHAFSDSSEKGFAAAIYIRIETPTSNHCQLIIGKSKVAPLKRSTIPRLELCGAVLAAKLLRLVLDSFDNRIKINQHYAWTDSTTALSWIRSSPHRWATFIANRVSQIHDLVSPSIWRHVPTQHNPVDCGSRGLFPSELLTHQLWWKGPNFLVDPPQQWPKLLITKENELDDISHDETRKPTVFLVKLQSSIGNLLERFSSLNKVLRILSYCFRLTMPRRFSRVSKVVSAEEFSHALLALVYHTQHMMYADDIDKLNKGMRPSKALRCLDLFVDKDGLVRVGGRLRNADIPYTHKHPLLLPSSHPLTILIIDHHHLRLKHPGPMALQTHLQREFWIQSARKIIRSRLRLCISCFRTRPTSTNPKMAALPKYRVQQVKPFAITGVDYAGPIRVKGSRVRTVHSPTTYICLFVCMTTKALHIELSSDLSTETFLLAFTRFTARRGPIREMHSDCGTQFIGASRLLTALQTLTHSQYFQDRDQQHCAQAPINWHFNPPSSPHFGGLWEAGVKSVKSLIIRTIGLHTLTSEELITLLTQIEATLNSRPLTAMSNDPNDLEALTPSHFLTLEPPTSLPEPNLETVPLSKLQRWRLVSDLQRHFWTRWKNEYLSTLQLRRKWTDQVKQLCMNDLVHIREPTHPLQWRLGRIRDLHPGSDGISRVATVQTTSGTFIRPIVKLCPLPIC